MLVWPQSFRALAISSRSNWEVRGRLPRRGRLDRGNQILAVGPLQHVVAGPQGDGLNDVRGTGKSAIDHYFRSTIHGLYYFRQHGNGGLCLIELPTSVIGDPYYLHSCINGLGERRSASAKP